MLKMIKKIIVIVMCLLLVSCAPKVLQYTENIGHKYDQIILNDGEYAYNGIFYNELVIDGEDVSVSDVICSRVIITEDVKEGDVNLHRVKSDEIKILGGGQNSVHIDDCDIDTVNICKKNSPVRVVFEGNTKVSNVVNNGNIVELIDEVNIHSLSVNNGAIVNINEGVIVNDITVGKGKDVSINNNGVVKQLLLNSPVELEGKGYIDIFKTINKEYIPDNIEQIGELLFVNKGSSILINPEKPMIVKPIVTPNIDIIQDVKPEQDVVLQSTPETIVVPDVTIKPEETIKPDVSPTPDVDEKPDETPKPEQDDIPMIPIISVVGNEVFSNDQYYLEFVFNEAGYAKDITKVLMDDLVLMGTSIELIDDKTIKIKNDEIQYLDNKEYNVTLLNDDSSIAYSSSVILVNANKLKPIDTYNVEFIDNNLVITLGQEISKVNNVKLIKDDFVTDININNYIQENKIIIPYDSINQLSDGRYKVKLEFIDTYVDNNEIYIDLLFTKKIEQYTVATNEINELVITMNSIDEVNKIKSIELMTDGIEPIVIDITNCIIVDNVITVPYSLINMLVNGTYSIKLSFTEKYEDIANKIFDLVFNNVPHKNDEIIFEFVDNNINILFPEGTDLSSIWSIRISNSHKDIILLRIIDFYISNNRIIIPFVNVGDIKGNTLVEFRGFFENVIISTNYNFTPHNKDVEIEENIENEVSEEGSV